MNEHLDIALFEKIPTCAFRNENLSYKAAGVLATIVSIEKPLIGKLPYNEIRCHMRGKPSNDEIRSCITELENEGYLISEIQKIKAENRSGYVRRNVTKVCADFEDKHRHLRPRR